MSLTDVAIRRLKPKAKPFKLYDGGGLFLWVQPNGSKWWRYEYRFLGKRKLLALGTYPEVSLADARERHKSARQNLAANTDPNEAKKETRRNLLINAENTLSTHTPLFILFLVGTVILVGVLTFVPALALGPVAEHITLHAGN